MNSVLGSVLRLIHNNMDAVEAPWMKCIAGRIRECSNEEFDKRLMSVYTQAIIFNSSTNLLEPYFLPVSHRLRSICEDLYAQELSLRQATRLESSEREDLETVLMKVNPTNGSRSPPRSHSELRDSRTGYLRLWPPADQIRRYPSILLAQAWRCSRRAAVSQHGRSVFHVVQIESLSLEENC